VGERTCSVEGCERKFYGRGYCQMHYKRWWKTGSIEPRVYTPKICNAEGCERQANVPGSARGWCGPHYQRWQRWGDPLGAHQPTVGVAECSIAACTALVIARGWCTKHWTRWDRYGAPEARMPGEVVDGRRVCPECGLDKLLPEYGQSRVYCRPCSAARARHRRRDPAVKAAMRREYLRRKEADPEAFARWARQWRSRNPDKVREHNATRRARLRAVVAESFDPYEVFERDDWICGLCDGPIDPSAAYPDPMSPSLDHVVPVSRGGVHSRANCQAAHLVCNIRKGARVA
jgi:5-methylcytosine-specific restriction endonuclease McrA